MTSRSALRSLTLAVLVLFFAGVAAPAAAALPAAPSGPEAALAWNALGWLHSLAESLLGFDGSVGEGDGPAPVYGEANTVADPDGNAVSLTADSSDPSSEESPIQGVTPLPR